MKAITKSLKTECEVLQLKFVIYYGSTRKQNLKKIMDVLLTELNSRGHTYVVVDDSVAPCSNCGFCICNDHCCIKDSFPNKELKDCEGIIILSPIFFFSFSAKAKAFLDRLFSVNLEGKILTSITTSGSETEDMFCGFDIVDEIVYRTSEYCGCKYVKPINFVTEDKELKHIDESMIKSFVDSLEV